MALFGGRGVKLKKRPAGACAYIECRGPYSAVPFDECYKKLYAWARGAGVRPGFTPFAIYPTDPKTTPESELVTRVAIPIHGDAEPAGDISIAQLPEMEVATLRHEAPADEYGRSYAELQKWVEDNGYIIAGPPMEIHTKKPKMVDGRMVIYSEIQFPVRKR